jgi:hypothetical protein
VRFVVEPQRETNFLNPEIKNPITRLENMFILELNLQEISKTGSKICSQFGLTQTAASNM